MPVSQLVEYFNDRIRAEQVPYLPEDPHPQRCGRGSCRRASRSRIPVYESPPWLPPFGPAFAVQNRSRGFCEQPGSAYLNKAAQTINYGVKQWSG